MEQRNEPTTAEIVSGLRSCPDCDSCLLSKKKCLDIEKVAANRLEQLERENAELKSRAEKAEAERDGMKDIKLSIPSDAIAVSVTIVSSAWSGQTKIRTYAFDADIKELSIDWGITIDDPNEK